MATRFTEDVGVTRYYAGIPAFPIRHHVIMAEEMKLGSPAPNQAINGNYFVLEFTGDSAIHNIRCTFHVPEDWKPGTDILVHIRWSPATTDAGNVRWGLNYTAVAANADEVLSGEGVSLSVVDAAELTEDEVLDTDYMIMAAANLAVNDCVGIKVNRNPGHEDDTYENPAALVHIEFTYIAKQTE
jgi:hypothetical protein